MRGVWTGAGLAIGAALGILFGLPAEGQKLGREPRFDPLIGEWRLRLSLVDMSGSYDLRPRARW